MNIKTLLIPILLTLSIFANDNLEKVSLQLLWKHQFEFAGFYMAKEKGFYKDVGLEVELKEFDFDTNIVKDVEEGKSTYGIGYPNIILDKSKGADITLISAILQSSPHVFISLKSSNINSVKNFKNKKVMIESDAIKTAPLLSLLYSQNIQLDDITTKPPSFNINDLINGKVDIYSAFISNEVYKLQQQNIPYIIWDPKDYGFDFYNDILFTSNKELQNHPSRVKRFREASLKGWEYAFNNIEETISLILKKYNTQNKTKEAYQYEANELKKLAYLNTDTLGDIDIAKIQRIIDIYNLIGLTHKSIDLKDFIYDPEKQKILLTPKEKAFLKKNPTITIHNEKYWAPFNFNENNTPKGYSIDYIQLLAKKLGIKTKFISGPSWSEFLTMMKQKKLDVVLNIVHDEKRQKYIEFTKPYQKHTNSLFTNLENINSLNDLKSRSIAVPKDFYLADFLRKNYPTITIDTYKNIPECIYAVIEGKSDAVIANFAVADYIFKKHNLSIKNIKLNIDKRLNFDLRIGISKQKPLLKNILEKAMDSVTEDEIRTLSNRWLSTLNSSVINNLKLTSLEKKYLQEKEHITMCIDPDWMPFEKLEKNKHVGISADYFKIFQETLGKKIEIIPTNSWSESLEYAKQRKCDLLSLAMETPSRKEYMNFTSPYLSVPLVVATNTSVTFINDVKVLEGKKIGIPKGYAFVEIFKEKYPYINIIEVPTLKEGLQQVKEGDLFGYIGTLASVGYMFQTEFTGELKIAGKFDELWELGIGVRNDDTILLGIMQKLIDNLDTATTQNILNNWLAIKYEQKVDYKFLWQILFIVSLVLFLFIYRQYILFQSNKNLQVLVDKKTKELTELNKSLEQKVEASVVEIRQKDKILHEQSKMAAMGEMIGNISHQWRQPLSIISTAASGMKMKIELDLFDPKEELKSLDAITDATQYLSATIDDFRNFLKPDQEKHNFNIKSVIDKTLFMFGNSFQNCNIDFVLELEDCEIVGNENELLQVLINILNNSKDAFSENDIKEDEKFIFISLDKLQNNVIINITDSGGGIDSKTIANIFEPYFTTKHKSIGTGIGLYMSYQIIRNKFNGNIIASNSTFEHNNTTLHGAKFEIIIPLPQT